MKQGKVLFMSACLLSATAGFSQPQGYEKSPVGLNFEAPTIDDITNVANPVVGEIVFDDGANKFYGRNSANDGWITLGTASNAGTLTTTISDNNYSFTDTDGVRTLLMDLSSTDRTVTLPTVGDNDERIISIKKIDSGTNKVTINTESTDKIDGTDSFILYSENDVVTIQSDGSNWKVLSARLAKRYYVEKLDSNVTSNGSVFSISVNSGKTYRIHLQADVVSKGGAVILTAKDGANTIGILRHEEKNNQSASPNNMIHGTWIYEMSGSTLSVDASSIDTGEQVTGGDSRSNTFITVEELDNYTEVSSF